MSRVAESELREQQPFNFYPFNENGLPVTRFNYQDNIFHQAPATEQNLTIEGGTDQTRYYVSGNFANEDGIIRSTSSRRASARVNLQQQLTPRLIGNVTANYITTNNQLQAFGEQNDYGIMGSLFFAPTNVDFRPVNGIYPLPPSLGTNPLLAIDRIRNPQTIDRFIGSTKLTWTPVTSLLLDYTIGVDNTSFEQDQFVPRGAVLGTAPLATGRSQSVFQSTLVVNQDAIGTYTWKPMGELRAADHRRRQLHVAARSYHAGSRERTRAGRRSRERRIGLLRHAARHRAPHARLLRAAGDRLARQALSHRRHSLRRVVDVRAVGALAGVPEVLGVVRASSRNRPGMLNNLRVCAARSAGRAVSQEFSTRTRSSSRYAQLPFAGRPGFANDVTFGNPTLRNERAREWEVGGDVGFLGGRAGLEATYYNRLVSDLLFFRPLATSTGFSRQFYPDRLDVEQGHRADAEYDERRAPELWLDLDGDVHAQQESRRESVDSGFPIGRRISESHSCRRAGRRVLRVVRRAQLRHRRAAARFARPLSSQQPDRRPRRNAAQRQAISGGNVQRLAQRHHRRPESEVDGLVPQ